MTKRPRVVSGEVPWVEQSRGERFGHRRKQRGDAEVGYYDGED